MSLFRRKRVKFGSLAEAVGWYRDRGFFAGFSGTDEETAGELQRRHQAEWDEPLDPSDDATLVELDERRVLRLDLEADAFAGGDAYVEVLPEVAAITRGRIVLGEVEEVWPDEEHCELRVVVNGTELRLTPRVDDDWLDADVLWAVDRAAGGPASLHLVPTGGQELCLVDLTPDEERELRRARGWRFDG